MSLPDGNLCMRHEFNHSFATLADVLARRARLHPERDAFIWLPDGEVEATRLSYQETYRQAIELAHWLLHTTEEQSRIVLLYPPGIEFIVAFIACIFAARIPVPLPAPRPKRGINDFLRIVNDSQARTVLTTSKLWSLRAAANSGDGHEVVWYATDTIDPSFECMCTLPPILPKMIAFLQYTSGSTSAPKGVVVSHENLASNERFIETAFRQDENSVVVSWLPHFHDMGLIGGILNPLWTGSRCVLMPASAFIEKPIRWLRSISKFKATTSGGPDFAYRFCVEKTTPEQREMLDLHTWSVAFNGSEPIRENSLRRFHDVFGPFGFDYKAFCPCYGLAEATLLVSARAPERQTITTAAPKLQEATELDCIAKSFVSCGRTEGENELLIIDPDTHVPCKPGSIGEIWFSGSGVANGYWNNVQETQRTFGAYTRAGAGPYLRTGDLGFQQNNELYIVGRLKDLIVVRGRNVYPEDIERIAASAVPHLSTESSASFGVELENGETSIVFVQELKNGESLDLLSLAREIRNVITAELALTLNTIIFARRGAVARTTSGKVMRSECRRRFLSGTLDILYEHSVLSQICEGTHSEPTSGEMLQRVRALAAEILKTDSENLDVTIPLSAQGLDSLSAVQLHAAMEQQFQLQIPVDVLLSGASIEQMCINAEPVQNGLQSTPVNSEGTHSLSEGQNAIWFLHNLNPDAPAYNIAIAARCVGTLDLDALRNALKDLMNRHEMLRCTIESHPSGPRHFVRDAVAEVPLEVIQAQDWDVCTTSEWMGAEARRPFRLEANVPVRVFYLTSGHCLFVFHHIVVDFWSLELLFHDLSLLYESFARGEQPVLPPVSKRYLDYVRWEARYASSAAAQSSLEYWRKQLFKSPSLELPLSQSRPRLQTSDGNLLTFRSTASLGLQVQQRARELGITPFAFVCTAFAVLLSRYTEQEDIIFGTSSSGRIRSEWSGVVGLFMNQLPVRVTADKSATFADTARELQRVIAEALAHQDVPFARIVQEINPTRDPSRSPIFQIMVSLYEPKHLPPNASLFVLGHPGAQLKLGALTFESIVPPYTPAQLDLTLMLSIVNGELFGSLQYNSNIFTQTQMSRMSQQLLILLRAAVDNPHSYTHHLPLLTEQEEHLLQLWNATEVKVDTQNNVYQLFESQAGRTPNGLAVTSSAGRLTYSELSRASSRVAAALTASGVTRGAVVAICMARSSDLLAGILGIMKSGAAFLPIDPIFPDRRIEFMISDTRASALLTDSDSLDRFKSIKCNVVAVESAIECCSHSMESQNVVLDDPAYILYTSGTTGQPKGVVVTHRNLTSFFLAMNTTVSCAVGDIFYATTSISFDISILELLWPLTNGACVALVRDVLQLTVDKPPQPIKAEERLDFSLFYFSSSDQSRHDKYRLLIEGARFADEHGFKAVWTPERHFHEFGGLFPNPAITSAAVAMVTKRVALRAGSVVLPLHNPIRVAEEWSVVDNLSNGRVGIAIASGWHADDFALAPDLYTRRREVMSANIVSLQRLWRGESLTVRNGTGKDIHVTLFPRPVQADLPMWITAAGTQATFVQAGEIGANLLTHLLGQSLEDVANNIARYRDALDNSGFDPKSRTVTLMLHTFLDNDVAAVRAKVEAPFKEYLKSSIGLISNLTKQLPAEVDLGHMRGSDLGTLLEYAFQRYFTSSALFGTVESCRDLALEARLRGVDEIACLIDFGVDTNDALCSCTYLASLMDSLKTSRTAQMQRHHGRRIFQSTPSALSLLIDDAQGAEFVKSLGTILVGGEILTQQLAKQLKELNPSCTLLNMYGPTETTIWSTAHQVVSTEAPIPIGRPIANTTIYILDSLRRQVPIGVAGEIYIGGTGVSRGYFNAPSQTASRFVPNPYSPGESNKLYRTGDHGRYLEDGTIEFIGRRDLQVKVRGYRIEIGEIEQVLSEHPDVKQCAVAIHDKNGSQHLAAYVVPRGLLPMSGVKLRDSLKDLLPDYMVPSGFLGCDALPLLPNGKVDRGQLSSCTCSSHTELSAVYVAPRSVEEELIATLWCSALRLNNVGIDDNFFDLGGHSLAMAQVHQALLKRYPDLPLVKLLEYPTVRQLALYLLTGDQRSEGENLRDRAKKRRQAVRDLQVQRSETRSALGG